MTALQVIQDFKKMIDRYHADVFPLSGLQKEFTRMARKYVRELDEEIRLKEEVELKGGKSRE